MSKILTATNEGQIKLGENTLRVAVLEDGTRIINYSAIFKAFGRTKRGAQKDESRVQNMPAFLNANNLQQFVSEELTSVLNKVDYLELSTGKETQGYQAIILPMLCKVYLEARAQNVLTKQQLPLARASEILLYGLSNIGITALIDEATGYQYTREKDELQKILSAYIATELLPWQKRFPDEFYKEIFRLNGWDYTVNGIQKRPGVIGTWTKKLIYNLLPKGVLEELENKTPKSEAGHKTARLHQSLTLDIGEPHLEKQLISVITLMNISDNWKEFLKNFGRKFKNDLIAIAQNNVTGNNAPKVSAKQYLMFEVGQTDLFANAVEQDAKVDETELSDFNNKLKTALNYNPKNKE